MHPSIRGDATDTQTNVRTDSPSYLLSPEPKRSATKRSLMRSVSRLSSPASRSVSERSRSLAFRAAVAVPFHHSPPHSTTTPTALLHSSRRARSRLEQQPNPPAPPPLARIHQPPPPPPPHGYSLDRVCVRAVGLGRRSRSGREERPLVCSCGFGFDLPLGCRSGRALGLLRWICHSEPRKLCKGASIVSQSSPPPAHRAMETLVISQQQRNQPHHSGRRRKSASQFSSAQYMRGYQAFNCRAFHSSVGIGILPSPPPLTPPGRTYSSPEPKTPKSQLCHGKKRGRAGSPPSGPELWAGPAYSNSPPPSSLPIPKFSLHQKRSASLELPPADRSDDVEVPVHAKSAPSSPTAGSVVGFFSGDTAIATENLRRILHLKITDH